MTYDAATFDRAFDAVAAIAAGVRVDEPASLYLTEVAGSWMRFRRPRSRRLRFVPTEGERNHILGAAKRFIRRRLEATGDLPTALEVRDHCKRECGIPPLTALWAMTMFVQLLVALRELLRN